MHPTRSSRTAHERGREAAGGDGADGHAAGRGENGALDEHDGWCGVV